MRKLRSHLLAHIVCAVLLCTAAAVAGPSDGRWRTKPPDGQSVAAVQGVGVEGKVVYTVMPITGAGSASTMVPDGQGGLTVMPVAPGIRPKPGGPLAPLKVRLADVTRNADGSMSYDLRFIGEVEGVHDLRTAVERIDLGPRRELPSVWVRTTAILSDAGFDAQLSPAEPAASVITGGYRRIAALALVLWSIPALGLLVWAVFKLADRLLKKPVRHSLSGPRKVTFADQLAPLIEEILAGRGTAMERARLEQLLLAFWRAKLSLGTVDISQAMMVLRNHPRAGALLRACDRWLHADPTRNTALTTAELSELLSPYATEPAVNLPIERLRTPATAQAGVT